jgi:hypothetical protein
MGLSKGSPAYQSYVLTGKMPREDAQPLSATDKKAIFEAEDENIIVNNTISTLKQAKELNPNTFTGYTAGARGKIGTSLPGASYVIDEKAAKATREFGQIMSMEAIKNMAETLKGATTDRELERFVEILADPSTPPDIRGRTIDRMLTLAERKKQLNDERISNLSGGTYFKSRQAAQTGGAGPATAAGKVFTHPSGATIERLD